MVAVRDKKNLASLIAVALVVGPAAVGSAGAALDTDDLACEEVDLDDECTSSVTNTSTTNGSESGTPGQTTAVDILIGPREPPADSLGQQAVDCRLDEKTDDLVCQPSEACRDDPDCRPPDICEITEEGRYRCTPERGRGPPDNPGSQGQQARGERGENPNRSGSNDTSSNESEGPECEPGPERGTLVCQPPPGCEDLLGQTDRCTPPSACQRHADGTFQCDIEAREDGPATTRQDSDADTADEAEARAQARSAIARSIRDTAETFRGELATMREDYEQRVDELRTEYAGDKAELRADYEDCRAQIPDELGPSQRDEEVQACIEEAREALASLRADVQARHDEVRQDVRDRAEQAREIACQQTEDAAVGAVGDYQLFTANPANLMPERALEMCPSLGVFDRGGASP